MNQRLTSGIDLVEISRFRNLSPSIRERFLKRVFTDKELHAIGSSLERAAGFFAVKEAVSKALGCGIGVIRWQEMEIIKNTDGRPELKLHGNALSISEKSHFFDWSISISHTKEYAIALVIAIVDDRVE